MLTGNKTKRRPELTLPRLWQAIAWLMVVFVITVTLMPKPPPAPGFLDWDKAQHFTAYAGLMWWFSQAFISTARWAIVLVLLGIGLEFIQGWSGYRHFEYADALANSLGVGGGLFLATTPAGRVIPWIDGLFSRYKWRSSD
jgi:VanZ family protein